MRRVIALALAILSLGAAHIVASPMSHADQPRATTTQSLEFPVRLTSAGSSLTELPGGVTYGWNDLRGPTTWGARSASLRFQGSVDYVDGTGPFGGFVTVTRSDGTALALTVTGYAIASAKGTPSRTKFRGTVAVIGGSGPYAGARGTGTVSGFRKSALGSPAKLAFAVTVERR